MLECKLVINCYFCFLFLTFLCYVLFFWCNCISFRCLHIECRSSYCFLFLSFGHVLGIRWQVLSYLCHFGISTDISVPHQNAPPAFHIYNSFMLFILYNDSFVIGTSIFCLSLDLSTLKKRSIQKTVRYWSFSRVRSINYR